MTQQSPDVPPFEPPLAWLRTKQGLKWGGSAPDQVPAWVADMDFPVAPVIRQSLLAMLDRGDLGYPDWLGATRHPLAEVFSDRSQRRFGWRPDPAHVRGITDLLAGLQILLGLVTEPGDGVIMQEPNYRPFRSTVPGMQREPIPLPVVLDGGTWRHDFDCLESTLPGRRPRVLLVVNPHNPTGTAFGAQELHRLADLALQHDLLVISDEIHADLVHEPNRHLPFAGISPEIADRTITLTSATKAFNIAGLRTAVAHIGPGAVRARWDAEPPDIHGVANVLGIEATRAAWEHGDDWLAGVRTHLLSQRDRLGRAVDAMPGVSLRIPDATYLAWLDCSGAQVGEDATAFFRRRARVRMSPGPDYGGGPQWARLNFATSTALLDQITGQMREALESFQSERK